MAPLTPSWAQPSHPDVQEVLVSSKTDFTTKSLSKIDLPPYGLFAKLDFPPCTSAEHATYATVQTGKSSHLNLNSDLVYINHSCDPTLIFDMSSMSIIAGSNGLKKGQELTFFYPSTEWSMAQGFDCFCNTANCRGFIFGASAMTSAQLEGMWLNAHIRDLLEKNTGTDVGVTGNKHAKQEVDETEQALRDSLFCAQTMVEKARKALDTYVHGTADKENGGLKNGGKGRNGIGSRELSGEMGGDTS
ncbi:hypothetical protein BP5796_06454 [Coleophoma crateriformis]|uniref:Post-SET domain-containing protein n=1 Tax=Coleophoma crateriformis TaxID=565419 RepID=A0A3D8RNL0_9HELO|nr:hypothetical protein BP5796_06454 [Coleophoma crateriformis]